MQPRPVPRNFSMASIDRLVAILNTFDGDLPDLSLAEVSRRSGLDRSTALRYLWALEARHLVERDPATGRYRPGLRLFQLGQLAMRDRSIRRLALPIMRDLLDAFGETVNLALFDQGDVVLIEALESSRSVRKGATVGERDPLHSTSLGKAILGALPRQRAEALLRQKGMPRFTPNTITTLTQMDRELDATARRGYAIDNEETEQGVRCAGVPILDQGGHPRYALSLSGPASRLSLTVLHKIGAALRERGRELSQRLGYAGEGAATDDHPESAARPRARMR